MIKKVLGPPGTGKTRQLLNFVQEYRDKGVPLSKIGYFAFTKKAAMEARERIIQSNPNVPKQDLKHFQTLHSLAFHTLGLSEDRVMQPEHYEQIGEELSIRVNYYKEGEEVCYLNCDNEYFKLINKARVRNTSIEEEFNTNEWSREIDFPTLQHINSYLTNFKEAFNLDDYTDMISKFVAQSHECPEFEVVFIDEAQDLAPIQWQMFDILKSRSKDIYLAGDDDQAIFAWAGADVNRFIDEPAQEVLLNQSERIPRAVQEISQIIVDRIEGNRKEKIYYPKKDKTTGDIIEGHVEHINSLEHLNLHEDKWLILTRTTYRANEICEELKKSNLFYKHYRFGKSFNTKLYKAILNWTEITNGGTITLADAKDIFEYLSVSYNIPEISNYSIISIEDLGFKKGITWYDVFTNADQNECLYIRNMLANGEKLSQEPRIEVSTIHAAKGGECKNVILVLDNAKKIREATSSSVDKLDEEHRVWYVGVTRSAYNLFLLKAKKERYGYQL